ncbi:hypothetical protein H0G86_001168 [Trichoderma simmonsii]|uniref:Uncharacterized protein n=1 Tax=Trichoderma simmonsii TaxID=1491479 RepID=A0A8G0L691_9HYPO|nr:hypothetical protein H0G86_001168 [Trichoderma simmonsii]
MGSVNVNRSKPQPSPLLKELGDGDYEDIESFWESSILDWDANYICDDICRGVKKCEEYDRMLAARGVEATVQDQLKELLGHDSTKLQLEPKKIQLLTEAMLGFLKMDKMPKKSKLVVKRMDISIRIVETICQLQPEIAFKPCPGEDYYTGKSIELQSAFQCALASKSEPLLGIINNKLLDSLKHDSETYFTQEAQKSQSREIDGDGETMSQVAAGKNPSDLLKLIFETSTLLPQAVRDEAMKVFKLIVNKNISLLNESIWEAAVTTPSPEMVQYLLLEIEDAMFLTGKNAAFVIENGTAPMWNMFPEEIRRAVISSPDFSLLRKIVSSGKADMVKAIIELEPSFIDVIVKQEGYEMLLQLLKDFNKGSAIEDKNDTYGIVRDLLVSSMIRDRNLSIQDIRDILQRSKMEGQSHIYLNLHKDVYLIE